MTGEFIAADVGGTHVRAGLVRAADDGTIAVLAWHNYASADYPSLTAALGEFIAANAGAGIDRIAIACPGVVLDDAVISANLPWRISLPELRQQLGLRQIGFVNDFHAVAHAGQCMTANATTLLTPDVGEAAPGPVLVIGPGTGLGAAVRIAHRAGTLVLPSEVSQSAFAPGSEREIEILRWMRRRDGYVATEQLVSGPGLSNLYLALCAIDGAAPSLSKPTEISAAARDGDRLAREAVLTFCALLGSVIGDVALICGARSVYIAGGILPQLKEFIDHSAFRARLLGKHMMRAVLERVPVRLIEDERLGIIGAASWSMQQLRED
ncbi:MAG: glucokinase [Luteimonas sp.]